MTTTLLDKAALRRQMRKARRALPQAFARQAARNLACGLAKLPVFRRAKRVAAYWPSDGEIDPTPLLLAALRAGKQVYLPVLHGKTLRFSPLRLGAAITSNRLGIPEPLGSKRQRRCASHLDLVLTPLVAFDAQGGRLGMGGGFYDRALHHLARPRRWRRPHSIGLAYALQQVDALSVEPWDVRLDGVHTEKRFYRAPALGV